ncbi:Nitrogenase component 1 type Oxidoreductase [Sporobacter termitidis DSM 10068]|uniref:Nitrogenase component 1 type Oxidoreductase n=1 Tax=Sporobacter termitidis DSM 10068 TaxID=1123282 RepID=A0A1M5WDD4_9FIRM|nr:nitrogenase component 1 [Sporobacter termitidis]SHH85437.1 Nitrogenase component 1 type Oxidoreductase [Sporobacter termitidis DSM 10068]
MKDLWQRIPPLSPDTSGFATVMYGTDGIGIIDDVRGCGGNHFTQEESRADLTRRVFSSEIGNEDVILGTQGRIVARFNRAAPKIHPRFAMISGSPISAFIGTDLAEAARALSREGGIPASYVELNGHGTYADGVSRTLVRLAELFTAPHDGPVSGVNVIGANHIDWSDAQVCDLAPWLNARDLSVVSGWGPREVSENFRRAAGAAVNFVVTSAGVRLAEWLRKQYGTPFVLGAPFGKTWSGLLAQALSGGGQPTCPAPEEKGRKVLIIGEQFCANALRYTLMSDFGFRDVSAASFFPMEKALMASRDIRLQSEEDLKRLLAEGGFDVVFGDPFMRCYAPAGCKWIDLPHRAVSAKLYMDRIPLLTGDNADTWLETVL